MDADHRAQSFVTVVLMALSLSPVFAQVPYKQMLDEPVSFTGPESQTADPADLAEIRIGLLAPDGAERPVGRALTRGARLAIEQANTAGGYRGVPFTLVRRWADDPWSAGAKEVIRMVYEDQVWAMIGSVDGASTHVAQQIVTKAHLVLVSPISSDPSLTHVRVPWIFRLAPDDQAQARALVDEIVSQGWHQVGLVTSSGHDGYTVATELTRELESRGVAPAFRLPVPAVASEYEDLVRRIVAFTPGCLILHTAAAETVALIEALGTAGVDCPILLPWVPGSTLDRYRPSYPGPLLVVEPFVEPRRCGPYLKLVHAYSRRYGSYPSPSAAYGYDAANLIIEAIRRGGLERRLIREQLAGLSGFTGATGTIEWDNGGGNKARPRAHFIGAVPESELQLPSWVSRLGYRPAELIEIEVGEYGYPFVAGYRIDEIRIGQIHFSAPSAKEKSFKGISEGLEQAIGLGIGSDLLARVLLTVDYLAGMVVLQEQGTADQAH
jgi:ABC-type branched-subunit amino acid transport system substrate-binding protein